MILIPGFFDVSRGWGCQRRACPIWLEWTGREMFCGCESWLPFGILGWFPFFCHTHAFLPLSSMKTVVEADCVPGKSQQTFYCPIRTCWRIFWHPTKWFDAEPSKIGHAFTKKSTSRSRKLMKCHWWQLFRHLHALEKEDDFQKFGHWKPTLKPQKCQFLGSSI